MLMDIGDVVKTKDGKICMYLYNPYISCFMWKIHNKDSRWIRLTENDIDKYMGNIFDIIPEC